MQTQDLVSPYDIPDASAAPLDHNEELSLEHDDHLDASLEPNDDLLDVELPLPPEDLSLDLPTNEHLDAPLIEAAAPVPDTTVPSPSKVRPPPPPRPPTRPSPPHETQQLILSVTGAMQVIIVSSSIRILDNAIFVDPTNIFCDKTASSSKFLILKLKLLILC